MLVIRFSIIPSHFSTAVFSTCNVKFWHFVVATFLTLPKQIVIVYVGVLLAQQQEKNSTVNNIVLAITFLTTVVAGVYVYRKMRITKKILLEEQAARLDAKKARAVNLNRVNSDSSSEREGLWQNRSYSPERTQFVPAETVREETRNYYEMDNRSRDVAYGYRYGVEENRRPTAVPRDFI